MMKTRWAVVVMVTALLQTATILAQATNPPYLSQMPTVERVKAEIKGSDPLDTAARQMGAFWRLMGIIKALAGPRFQSNQSTADEIRLMLRYEDAWQRYQYRVNSPPPADQPRWHKLRDFYDTDPALLDELLQRFFSAAFRTGYYRAIGKQPPSSLPPTQPEAARPPVAGNRPQPSAPNANSAEAYVAQGDKYWAAKDYTKAIEAYKRAIAVNPFYEVAYSELGACYIVTEQWQLAIAALNHALALRPYASAFRLLGDAHRELKQYDEALRAYRGLGRNDPKQNSNALRAFQQAVRLKPDEADYQV